MQPKSSGKKVGGDQKAGDKTCSGPHTGMHVHICVCVSAAMNMRPPIDKGTILMCVLQQIKILQTNYIYSKTAQLTPGANHAASDCWWTARIGTSELANTRIRLL
jgi:hypothetical protein